MAFKSTAYSDIIPTSLPLTYPKICDQKATHIISKIVYGQNAYFFFKHAKKSGSEKQDVAGTLQAVVKLIPGFSIQGSASVKLTGEEKKLTESTEVRFNGDFRLENGFPTTYDGAVDALKNLSSKLKQILYDIYCLCHCNKGNALIITFTCREKVKNHKYL